MLTAFEKEQLQQKIIAGIRERYGILLISTDVLLEDGDQLTIRIKGAPFLVLQALNTVDPVEAVLVQFFDEAFQAKEKLIELKRTQLESILQEEILTIDKTLKEKHKNHTYFIEVVSLGYEGSSWMLPEEVEFGYPDFGIQVKDEQRFSFHYKVDTDSPKRFLDMETILNRLDHQIASSF